jgi:NADH:ubiquinone reductase (H+-translocating)
VGAVVVYLMKLPRFEKKMRVALQWTFDLFYKRDLGQYITMRDIESLTRLLEAARKNPAA